VANALPVSHKVLTLNGAAQQLALALDMPGVRIRSLSLQAGAANTHAVYVGGPAVSDTVYGVRLPIPVESTPAAPYMIEDFDEGTELKDWYVFGTNGEALHLLILAYV
jgi:hypothetical protein